MKKLLMKTGLSILWLAAGQLGRDLLSWIELAENHGLSGRQAFDYVWRKARIRYRDIGGWLLNMLIEVLLAKHMAQQGQLDASLEWPAGPAGQ